MVSRLLKIGEEPTSKAAVARFAEEAQALLDPQRPGDFNQVSLQLHPLNCAHLHVLLISKETFPFSRSAMRCSGRITRGWLRALSRHRTL